MAVMLNPIDPDFQQNPYPKFSELRREAPVFRHPGGFYAISRYRDVAHVLKTPEVFSSKAMGGMDMPAGRSDLNPSQGSLIGKDPPVHTRMRSIVNRGFTPRGIAALEPRIRAVVDELFAKFVDTGECDLMRDLAVPMPVIMIAELLGMDPSMRDDFKRWAHSLMIGSTGLHPPEEQLRHLANVREFSRYMRQCTEDRRKNPGDDLISQLIHAEEEDGFLTADEVVGFSSLLLFAGSETTSNLIGNAALALLGHPEQLERVLADRSLVPNVLEETLRYDSPVQMLMRLSVEDTELGGVAVAKNAFVFTLLGSANRDGAQFDDADRFDIDRNTQSHLGFGLGNHFCLGAALARLQARAALETILDRLPRFRLAKQEPIERHRSFLIRGPAALPLRFGA